MITTVYWLKLYYNDACNKTVSRVVTRQCLSANIMDDLAFVNNNIPWHTMYLMNDCRQQANFFYDHTNAAIEMHWTASNATNCH